MTIQEMQFELERTKSALAHRELMYNCAIMEIEHLKRTLAEQDKLLDATKQILTTLETNLQTR